MQGPANAGAYPEPIYANYPSARAYVRDLQNRVQQSVAQSFSLNIPDYVAGQTRFSLPGFPGVQLSYPTSRQTAASLYRRIQRLVRFRNQFRNFVDQFRIEGTTQALTTPVEDPTSLALAPPDLVNQFDTATISVYVVGWQGTEEVTQTATVTVTPSELQAFLASDDGSANVQEFWINNWANQANFNGGSEGFITRLYFANVISVDYSNQSINNNVTQGMNDLRRRLRPPAPTTRQTRSMTRSARMSTQIMTRSRARALQGRGVQPRSAHSRRDDSSLYDVDPMRGTLYAIRPDSGMDARHVRFRDVNAPVITNPMVQPISLAEYQRHRMDSSDVYKSQYLIDMPREKKRNMCWFAAVCDLVNHACGNTVLTFELLLDHLNYNRESMNFVPHNLLTVQEQGLSIDDMDCIFQAFDRRVLVYNIACELLYDRQGNRHKRRTMKPTTWCFVVGHGHVYPIHGYDHRSFQKMQQARFDVFARQNNTDKLEDRPKPMTYMFPSALRMMPSDLRLTQARTKEVDRITHVLLRDTSLFQILMQPPIEWKDTKMVILVDGRISLEEIYMRMVHEFHHRPEVYFMRHYVALLDASSHGHYRRLIFKGMNFLNTEKEPDMITSTGQYLRFKEHTYELRRTLYHTSFLSFINEDTHAVFTTFPRTPYIGFMPGVTASNSKPLAPFAGVDYNRLYGHTLQTITHVPIIFPFSKFAKPKQTILNLKKESFVLGRVHGDKTAYLNEDYMLLWLPNLLEHVEGMGGDGTVALEYNPVHFYRYRTVFQIEFICETVRMVPVGNRIRDVLRNLWRDMDLPKSAKKMMVNVSIGILGTKENDIDAYQKVTVLSDMEELSLLSPSMNSEKYTIVAMDDENFAVVPKTMKSARRYQTGMLLHQMLVDSAVLRVANTVDVMHRRGIKVMQVNTDEIIFPQANMPEVDDLLYDHEHDTFESNGGLKKSKEDLRALYEIPAVMNQNVEQQSIFYGAKKEVADRAPATTDYSIVPRTTDLQEHPRILLTASVPGAGKTHTVCTQEGITGVIAVPTNALAVDLKSKFPQHKVVTIHKLLGGVARAFGLLDFVEEKPIDDTPEENIEEADEVEMRKATKGIFRDGDTFLCVDEIYMLPSAVLLALYHYLKFLPEGITHVYATGDPCQLDPVEDLDRTMNSKAAREAMIVNMFPVRIHLEECKRNHTAELNRQTEKFCQFLQRNRALNFSNGIIPALRSICHQNHVNIITEYAEVVHIMKTQEDMLIAAYTNKTCHDLTESVLGSLKGKLASGTKLINRKRKYLRGGKWMHLNYVYEVQDYNPGRGTVKLSEERVQNEEADIDMEAPSFWLEEEHVLKYMHWHRTRTAHCLQGTSWDGGVIVTDVTKKHLVNRAYFYVTMTRARDFSRLYVFIPN